MPDFARLVSRAAETVTPDLNKIYDRHCESDVPSWVSKQKLTVTASGAGAAMIPVMHLAGLAADTGFLIHRLAVCCFGIGAIVGRRRSIGNMLEREDFAIILGRWAGASALSDEALTKLIATAAPDAGSVSAKAFARFAAQKTGLFADLKVGGGIAAKVAGKFRPKLRRRAIIGFIPLLGAASGAMTNRRFVESISKEAEAWYEFKAKW